MTSTPLQTYIHSSSEKGLSSVTTLIVGTKSSILIDPPFLIPDALSIVSWIRKTTSNSLRAVFVTHHHPDHYFSANPMLEAFPTAAFYAALYVCAGIDREYDDKVKFWPTVFGKENCTRNAKEAKSLSVQLCLARWEPEQSDHVTRPGSGRFFRSYVVLAADRKDDRYRRYAIWQEYTCLVRAFPGFRSDFHGADALKGLKRSKHPKFYMHGRTYVILHPNIVGCEAHCSKVIKLIDSLAPSKIIIGHLETGWELDAKADMEHNRKYLALSKQKIADAETKPSVQDIYDTFKGGFPEAKKNLDFFLGHLSNQLREGGRI